MKRTFKKIISLSVLLIVCAAFAADPEKIVTPKFTIRSQGTNAARRMVGSVNNVMLADMDQRYGTLSLTPEYTRSYDRKAIAECLFGDSLCNKRVLKIQGSKVVNRDNEALLADYFYLPTDFSSKVSVKPVIQNFLVDINYFVGLDNWLQGLYIFAQAPITYTKWSLNVCELVKDVGDNDHDQGYFTADTLERKNLLTSFKEYAQGKAPDTVKSDARSSFDSTTLDTAFQGLTCSKICGGTDKKTALSEVRLALGYNFVLDEDYHVGLNLQVVAPTGNNPKADYLFAAQNGNDNHWEVGGALSASYVFWRSEDNEKQWGIYLDANLTHMFKNSQKRCFDLCGKPLSRYMLAEKMTGRIADGLESAVAPNAAPSAQFAGIFAPVANITALNVDVSVGINADIVLMSNYTCGNWSWDLGYNFWGRSCEKIKLDCECPEFEENKWALKGDAQVYGFLTAEGPGDPVALSASNNKATINGGNNFGKQGFTTTAACNTGKRNPNIDNAEFAQSNGTALITQNSETIRSSFDPTFIKQDDINFVRTKGISHKVFSHLSYSWEDNDWNPYLGVGFEIEFATDRSVCGDCSDCSSCDDDCSTDCDTDCDNTKTSGDCIKCGLDQWGIMVKGGIDF